MFVWWWTIRHTTNDNIVSFSQLLLPARSYTSSNIMQCTMQCFLNIDRSLWILCNSLCITNKTERRNNLVLLLVFVQNWVCSFPIIILILCRENPLIRAFLLLIGVFTEHSGKILFEDLISVKGFRYFRLWL